MRPGRVDTETEISEVDNAHLERSVIIKSGSIKYNGSSTCNVKIKMKNLNNEIF